MVTEWRALDKAAASSRRISENKAEEAKREAAEIKKAEKQNATSEILLVKSAVELDDAMSAVGTAGSRKKEILMQQIDARTTRPKLHLSLQDRQGPSRRGEGHRRGGRASPGLGDQDDRH